jgi:hypothetical protein
VCAPSDQRNAEEIDETSKNHVGWDEQAGVGGWVGYEEGVEGGISRASRCDS